ncbi:hypothetical protein F5J12DRAFT_787219 [Pisolithus orientalis]|uniref:uncharacterized protein n=1 Tax=Pisolithus orientalis TaxID=936130 RepID=UPI0022248373|nr:uncharacterized protein F5J12DRAFT_787219 [Pisolithus orientalis]KAI5986542.1 hypothetical protein F5J12DRAFT_787219 [Pisolithus orientalis]
MINEKHAIIGTIFGNASHTPLSTCKFGLGGIGDWGGVICNPTSDSVFRLYLQCQVFFKCDGVQLNSDTAHQTMTATFSSQCPNLPVMLGYPWKWNRGIELLTMDDAGVISHLHEILLAGVLHFPEKRSNYIYLNSTYTEQQHLYSQAHVNYQANNQDCFLTPFQNQIAYHDSCATGNREFHIPCVKPQSMMIAKEVCMVDGLSITQHWVALGGVPPQNNPKFSLLHI